MNKRFLLAISISLAGHVLGLYLLAITNHHLASADNDTVLIISLKKGMNPSSSESKVAASEFSDSSSDSESKFKDIDLDSIVPKNQTNQTPESSWFSFPEPKYYSLKELDHPPLLLSEIDNSPEELKKYSKGGQVKIQLWIDEYGEVERAMVVETDLPQIYKDYTLKNFGHAKFKAGIKADSPVKSTVKIVVQYTELTENPI